MTPQTPSTTSAEKRPFLAYTRVARHQTHPSHYCSQDIQRAQIERYVAKHDDIDVADWIDDEGPSGFSVKNRPELRAALDLVLNGTYAGIIVSNLDRLTRNVQDTLEIADRLHTAGASLICAGDGIDTSSRDGRLKMQLFAALYAAERQSRSHRALAARWRANQRSADTEHRDTQTT